MAGGGAPPPEAMKRGMSGKITAVIVVVVAVAAFLGGLGAGAFVYAPRPVPDLINANNAPFPPFESYDDTSKMFVGFNIDIAREIANATGRRLVIVNFIDYGILQASVATGGVDMSVSSMTITDARNTTMDFSDVYWKANQAALVKADSTFACANAASCTPAELAGGATDNVIGVQLATTSESWVVANVAPLMNDPGLNIKKFDSVATEIAALQAGGVAIVVIDEPVAEFYGKPGGSFKKAGTIPTGELYGVAVQNGDPQGLIPIINAVLRQLRDSGKYDQLVQYWFT